MHEEIAFEDDGKVMLLFVLHVRRANEDVERERPPTPMSEMVSYELNGSTVYSKLLTCLYSHTNWLYKCKDNYINC